MLEKTDHGCRSRTDITVNGHSYFASYGRTQFVLETFLRTLNNLLPPGVLTAAERHQLGLDQPVIRPDGISGTMADMVGLGLRRATAAGHAYRDFRARFGRGRTADQARIAWDSLSPAERSAFEISTGLGRTEFIDMLGYRAGSLARTENEGLNAFASEAAIRLLDGQRPPRPVFWTWLSGLFSSQDNYNFVSRMFLKQNLARVMVLLPGRSTNSNAPGTTAHATRQREIELDLAEKVAILHNSGDDRLVTRVGALPPYLQTYVTQFTRTAGRGDWQSLRCSDQLGNRNGLQMQPLELK